MHFRSIISAFLLICLVVLTLLGNVAESGKVLDNKHQNNHLNKNNFLVQRMKRRVPSTYQRSKRDDFGAGNGGYQPQQAGDSAQQPGNQLPQSDSQAPQVDDQPQQFGNQASQPNDQPQQFNSQAQPDDPSPQSNGQNQGGFDTN